MRYVIKKLLQALSLVRLTYLETSKSNEPEEVSNLEFNMADCFFSTVTKFVQLSVR